MATYIIRNLDEDLWTRVKTRAQRDGWPLRPLLDRLLEDYASGTITPSGVVPPRPPRNPDA